MRINKMKHKLYKKYNKRPEVKQHMQQSKRINAYDDIIKKIIKRGILCQYN